MGIFADQSDVTGRYEGDFPDDRLPWVDLRISDVEADLILMVPSLGIPADQIEPNRVAKAKSLVANKVLDLFRNPERYQQHNEGPYGGNYGSVKLVSEFFTAAELQSVRLRTKRSNLGVARVAPWNVRNTCLPPDIA